MSYQSLSQTLKSLSSFDWYSLYQDIGGVQKDILRHYASIRFVWGKEKVMAKNVIVPHYTNDGYVSHDMALINTTHRESGKRINVDMRLHGESLHLYDIKTNDKGMNWLLDYPFKKQKYTLTEKTINEQIGNTLEMLDILKKMKLNPSEKDIENFVQLFEDDFLLFMMVLGLNKEVGLQTTEYLTSIRHPALHYVCSSDAVVDFVKKFKQKLEYDIPKPSKENLDNIQYAVSKHSLVLSILREDYRLEKMTVIYQYHQLKDSLSKNQSENEKSQKRKKI